jgi:hypothetical protein
MKILPIKLSPLEINIDIFGWWVDIFQIEIGKFKGSFFSIQREGNIWQFDLFYLAQLYDLIESYISKFDEFDR